MATNNSGSYLYGATPAAYSSTNINREDLLGLITNVDPTYTPWLTTTPKTTAKDAMAHYWLKDTLPTADLTGAIEGADYSRNSTTQATREYNWTWIGRRDIQVSETQRQANPAAFVDTYAYEQNKSGKAILRNLEILAFANNGVTAASALNSFAASGTASATNGGAYTWTSSSGSSATSTAGIRYPKNIESFLTSNVMYSTDYSTPAATVTQAGIIGVNDVTQMLNNIWTNGGEPDSIWVNAAVKRQMSAFVQTQQNRNVLAEDKKLIMAVDVLDTEFGLKTIILNRWVPQAANTSSSTATATASASGKDVSGRAFFLERRNVRLATYRPLAHAFVGKLGDSVSGYMAGEWTFEVLNEKSCGVMKGLSNKSAVS